MPPNATDMRAEKSYLSSAVDSINLWSTKRAPTPVQDSDDKADAKVASQASANPEDHSITRIHGQSFGTYPTDCPRLKVQWFHAVDIPKRKPKIVKGLQVQPDSKKPPAQPKKFLLFSPSDSKALESRYQRILEASEQDANHATSVDTASLNAPPTPADKVDVHVAVNEDFLFDVNIEERELFPAYWHGPVYEVRRGTWFYQEGSALRPCEENLAAQLEEGYLKTKPWLNPVRSRSSSSPARDLTPRVSQENLKYAGADTGAKTSTKATKPQLAPSQGLHQPQSYRLFGTYMNSTATYQDANTAWLSSEGVLSWVTTSVYERFAGGGFFSGVKVVRGYAEISKAKEKDQDKSKNKDKVEKPPAPPIDNIPGRDEDQQKLLKRRSAPSDERVLVDEQKVDKDEDLPTDPRRARLHRELSSLMGSNESKPEEQVRQQEEEEILGDYSMQAGETQGREIDHLVLVTHGIGQLLSLRMDSFNFVHDVNVMRKTIKGVYARSADLKALNSELDSGPGNCKVQVLPVCWRHLLEFPRRQTQRAEHDLGDTEGEEDEYPSLEDITIEGMAFARSLISDLALDVLLYQSSYREEISRIVLRECNRIYRLFRERNPDFKGKVHLIGHSLGSAILFDTLCRQREPQAEGRNPLRFWPASSPSRQEAKTKGHDLTFEFDVEDFYCLGSPVGLFQMLKGRTIAARQSPHAAASQSPLDLEAKEDPFLTASMDRHAENISQVTGLPVTVSSPRMAQIFNIFHPSDPISYRLEPLISPAMSILKPQLLPYTKRGIFGNVAPQGLSGIGSKVGQSVSGLWSSLSSGIASSMLTRSLGISNEEVARLTADAQVAQNRGPDASADIAGEAVAEATKSSLKTDIRKMQLADQTGIGSDDGKDPTLIDDELETLYSRFQKKRTELATGGEAEKLKQEDKKARKMRIEETKVRALNRTGRVDFSIQESVLDFNPINTIASHMSYWADEDVNHFILSQMLSNRTQKKS